MADDGVYCSTAGTFFQQREDLQEHYQSEFHKYNLKRKIAGLPPVTREWYEARRAQLSSTSNAPVQRVWFDPLTKKKFYSENTYLALTKSKKYQELVKKSKQPAPAAIVTIRRLNEDTTTSQQPAPPSSAPTTMIASKPAGFTIKPAVPANPHPDLVNKQHEHTDQQQSDQQQGDESGSEWETASEEEMQGGENWEEWNICQSLFDNHISTSMEANLEYMWKKFGFYLPDSEFLIDPEGLIKYLGAKLLYGHVPLYESGDNPNAKQFTSLHAVQRHMIDSNRCKILFDDNEDEYIDFYDYNADNDMDVDGANRSLILSVDADESTTAAGKYELALPSTAPGGGVKYLGSREFARYYKQRYRTGDHRASTLAAQVVAQYRQLSVPLLGDGTSGSSAEERKRVVREHRAAQRVERVRIATALRRNVNDNLPKNVPY